MLDYLIDQQLFVIVTVNYGDGPKHYAGYMEAYDKAAGLVKLRRLTGGIFLFPLGSVCVMEIRPGA